MSEKIGSQGIGLYGLVCSVYFFFASFSVSGMSLAVVRLVSDSIANKKNGFGRSIFRKCLLVAVFTGLTSSFLLFHLSEFVAFRILSDQRAVASLKILSIALPFISFSACFRGYFYATGHILKVASEQLIEQIIEIIVFVVLLKRIESDDIEKSCLAIVAGTTAAEAISCLHSYLMYLIYISKNKICELPVKTNEKSKVLRKIFSISVPTTLSTCVRTGLNATENILIPHGLRGFGMSSDKSLSNYGMIKGMIIPIITFPAVLIFAFSTLLVPEISRENITNNINKIRHISSRVLRFTLMFSAFIMGIFWIFPVLIGNFIYKSSECGIYLFILCPLAPFIYISDVLDNILKGLNQQVHYLLYIVIDSIFCMILLYFLLPKYGMKGLIITIFSGEILNFFLTSCRLIKIINLKILFTDWLLKPLMCAIVSCVISKSLLIKFLLTNENLEKLIFSILISLGFYLLLLYVVNLLENDEKYILKKIFWFKKPRTCKSSSL
jgi:stage V sporulation protein B